MRRFRIKWWLGGLALCVGCGPSKAPAPPVAVHRIPVSDNFKQISLAVQMYSADNNDYLPPAPNSQAVHVPLDPYLKSAEVWKHPASGEIFYNTALSGLNVQDVPAPGNAVLLYQDPPMDGGRRWVAYVDGAVK